MVVGEGGCSPEYFFNKMTPAETRDYLEGLSKRNRSSWEQTRSLLRLVYGVATGKELELELPWDEKRVVEPVTKEDLEEMRKKAKEMEERLNNFNNNKNK